ncbi:Hypothetical protein GSB_152408 [Giardia duodenalis]|uniref:Uncharacterized protein n=1 Tax=Giardia intestinalis TaxID=5741 RepID=V6U0I1_GIAIN|nr:Hypothetical protein GSB_152408 [Giardia intestinalis]
MQAPAFDNIQSYSIISNHIQSPLKSPHIRLSSKLKLELLFSANFYHNISVASYDG